MATLADSHWTENSVDDFVYRITSDFVDQLICFIEERGTTQAELARALNVSEGRVSQVLNNPGNLTLRKVVEYARALNKKVSIVAYDDNDPNNRKGPIRSEIFTDCWVRAGRPSDFFELAGTQQRLETPVLLVAGDMPIVFPSANWSASTANNSVGSGFLGNTVFVTDGIWQKQSK